MAHLGATSDRGSLGVACGVAGSVAGMAPALIDTVDHRRTFANRVMRSCEPFGFVFDLGLPQLMARETARMSLLSA